MRYLLVPLVMLVSGSAFANPFVGFTGTYLVVGAPQIENEGMRDCERHLVGVEIGQQGAHFGATLIAIINNSRVQFFTAFREYNSGGSHDVINAGYFLGDAEGPRYQTMDSAPWSLTMNTFAMTRKDGAVTLRLTYAHTSRNTRVARCAYTVSLSKQ